VSTCQKLRAGGAAEVVLQLSYSGITAVVQWCYSGVPELNSSWGWKSVLYECYKSVTGVLQESNKIVTRV
jgi:hypothetical protein